MKKRLMAVFMLMLVIMTFISGQIQVNANPLVIAEGTKIVIALALTALGLHFANETEMTTNVFKVWRESNAEQKANWVLLGESIQYGVKNYLAPEMKEKWNSLITDMTTNWQYIKDFYGLDKSYNTYFPDVSYITDEYSIEISSTSAAGNYYGEIEIGSGEDIVINAGFFQAKAYITGGQGGIVNLDAWSDNGTYLRYESIPILNTYNRMALYYKPYILTTVSKIALLLGVSLKRAGYNTYSSVTNHFGRNSSDCKWYVTFPGQTEKEITNDGKPACQWYIDGIPYGYAGEFGGTSGQTVFYHLLYEASAYSYTSTAVTKMPTIENEQDVAISVPLNYTGVLSKTASDVLVDTATEMPQPTDPGDTEGKMRRFSLPAMIFKEKFPFCLPWDLYNVFAQLVVPAEPPVLNITIPLSKVGLHDEELTMDFTQYEQLATISRWGLSVVFVIGLILLTRKIIGAQ